MVWLNASTSQTGRKSQKTPLNLFKCITTKSVLTVRKLLKEDQAATRSFVHASRSFVLFVEKNGCLITQPMVINLVTSTNKLWL